MTLKVTDNQYGRLSLAFCYEFVVKLVVRHDVQQILDTLKRMEIESNGLRSVSYGGSDQIVAAIGALPHILVPIHHPAPVVAVDRCPE